MYSIVIPAYNEENRIGQTLKDYAYLLNKNKLSYELIIVCDGCTDNTVGVVKKYQKSNKKIKLFVLPNRMGKGGGVYYGFSKCTGNILGFIDADNAIRPGECLKLFNEFNNADCVIASRMVKNAVMKMPHRSVLYGLIMRLFSRVFNKLMNLIFDLNIRDTQCGAKFMKKNVYDKIKNELWVCGFEFDVELLWRIKERGYKIKEVGIVWRHDLESKTSVFNSLNMLLSMLKRKYLVRV